MQNDKFTLAITGRAFSYLVSSIGEPGVAAHFEQVMKKGKIFARMRPEEKQQLILQL
jgi:magnesium-transporting ATPase (P-type)